MASDIKCDERNLRLEGELIAAFASNGFAVVAADTACLSAGNAVALTGHNSANIKAPRIKLDGDVVMTGSVTLTVSGERKVPDPAGETSFVLEPFTERVDLIELVFAMRGEIAGLKAQVTDLQSRLP